MTPKPIVQIKNLKKNIGKKQIIKGISFDVYGGEVFGFLGPNGAGKTTTIRMLLGLISITEGEIYIESHSITKDFEKAIAHVGGIVENPDMYKHLSGYKNLVHYARMYTNVRKERIDEVIRLVGLENRVNDKVKTYSLGMRQRLGLAQALLHSPSLLVLDEPTNGLDPAGIHELRNLLRDLAHKENIAVFVSSHLLSEMELMCDRVGIIQNGSLVDIQTLTDMLQDEKTSSIVAFNVTPLDKAKEILENLSSSYKPAIKENEIEVSIETEDIPVIVEKLVEQKIRIYGIYKPTRNLEAKFLEVTGGNEIA
ncbi:ABC transporter ATP-binding protein [Clostridium swellfunianum]|uniref:ABC transporter ATP-binding protein n=1 Tax=Clostridium swellfunianum TaxID=1367462 RepID=UPI0020301B68|nr:ABC transporter ATP-binding protein [Clostridium swellfunianum]MCM0648023.1 ABC transporter ATP-binding protein [Clostridium swellfunianum]